MTSCGKPSWLHHKRRPTGERGSLAVLLMVMLVGLMLSALLVPMIITQNRTTRFDSSRVQALNAAQAGIDVSLGAIRAAVDTVGIGVSGKLPCGTQSGIVNGASVAAYSVVIEYFRFDPVTYPYPALPSQVMKCVPGYGTFDLVSGATTPGFARFTSAGTVGTATNGSTAGRTLTSTYVFRTSNINILGGLVKISPATANLCMDVGSPTAPAATPVKLQLCSVTTPLAAQQVFSYRTDLTLQLVSSITLANPNGLCLNSAATPAVGGNAVRLNQCGLLGVPAAYTQQWSYNDNGQYQAAQSSSATDGSLPNLCMNVATQAANQAVILNSCGTGWIPSPSVGPGAAALPQWINYSEFGRCLDVTAQDVNKAFLIDYPCKQNPSPGAKTWNQLFQAPAIPAGQPSATGQISTCTSVPATTSASVCNAQKYCLTSPGTNGSLVTSYVTVKTCDINNTKQTWIIYGGDSSLNYSTKYTIVNGALCLGLSAPNAELTDWSTIDVETCTGATEQKWNAVPNLLISALKNIHEN
jgi:Ricin-type beta-trefoil lectin domain